MFIGLSSKFVVALFIRCAYPQIDFRNLWIRYILCQQWSKKKQATCHVYWFLVYFSLIYCVCQWKQLCGWYCAWTKQWCNLLSKQSEKKFKYNMHDANSRSIKGLVQSSIVWWLTIDISLYNNFLTWEDIKICFRSYINNFEII